MKCYINKDPAKNIGQTSGREFAVCFEKGNGFAIYRDGTKKLIKDFASGDEMVLEGDSQDPNGQIICVDFDKIPWTQKA